MDFQTMTEKSDTWSTASKWLMGGAAALVVTAFVGVGNFVAGAVWKEIKNEIVTEVQAQTQAEVDAKIKRLADENEKTRGEIENLRTAQQALIGETGDLKDAVDAQTVIGKQILQLLEAQQ
jgi:outer membrane murein-binding lipoprotein Lpp